MASRSLITKFKGVPTRLVVLSRGNQSRFASCGAILRSSSAQTMPNKLFSPSLLTTQRAYIHLSKTYLSMFFFFIILETENNLFLKKKKKKK